MRAMRRGGGVRTPPHAQIAENLWRSRKARDTRRPGGSAGRRRARSARRGPHGGAAPRTRSRGLRPHGRVPGGGPRTPAPRLTQNQPPRPALVTCRAVAACLYVPGQTPPSSKPSERAGGVACTPSCWRIACSRLRLRRLTSIAVKRSVRTGLPTHPAVAGGLRTSGQERLARAPCSNRWCPHRRFHGFDHRRPRARRFCCNAR